MSDMGALKLFEAILIIVGVLGFAVYQLVSVRRSLKRDREKRAADGQPTDRNRFGG